MQLIPHMRWLPQSLSFVLLSTVHVEQGRSLGHLALLNPAAATCLEAIEEVLQLATLVVELHPKSGYIGARKSSTRNTPLWRRGEQRRHVTSKGALWVDRAIEP